MVFPDAGELFSFFLSGTAVEQASRAELTYQIVNCGTTATLPAAGAEDIPA